MRRRAGGNYPLAMHRLIRVLLSVFSAVAATALCLLAAAAVPRPAADVLRRDLGRILARPEYNQSNTMWLQILLIRAIRRLLQWWNDHIVGVSERTPALYWAVVVICLLVLTFVIYHIYVTMRSAFGTGRRRGPRLRGEPVGRPTNDPQALLDQAEAAARAGAFPEALRYQYLALIHHLDRRSVLRYDIAHTNEEYLRQARKFPVLMEPLRAVTRLADRAWYGRYRLGAGEYEHCRELVQTVWQEAEHVAAV